MERSVIIAGFGGQGILFAGHVLADAGRGVGMVTQDLDLERQRITHFFFEKKYGRTAAVTASRRPELYADLARTVFTRKALAALRRKGTT